MSAEYKDTTGIYTRKYQAKNIWEAGGACVERQRKFGKVGLHGAKWPNFAPWRKSPCEMVFPWLDAVVFQRSYLPHFSSKSYTVWSVGFLTSWYLKWYIACRKWTSGSAPKVWRKTAAAVLYSLHSVFLFASLLYLACLNDPKICQYTQTSHKYD